jgi:aryl-alcohol dehydrogenase-like predicted oxidoreductase
MLAFAAGALPPMTPLTMGTGGITDPTNAEMCRVARMGMEAGIWFHVADYGGGVYATLAQAFKEDPAHVPPCIFKVDGTSATGFRESLEDALRRTGKERIEIGQVCGNPVDESLEPLAAQLLKAREEGLVGSYIMDVIYPYSPKVLQAVQANLFDGYIFYYNVVEREVSNAADALMMERGTPVLAMRTFGGRDGGNFASDPAHPRVQAVEAFYQQSGCATRTEFCVRFPLSLPHVRTTIGSTSRVANLKLFLEAGRNPQPLAPEIVAGIQAVQNAYNAGR